MRKNSRILRIPVF